MKTLYNGLAYINYVFAILGLINGEYLQFSVNLIVAGVMFYAAANVEKESK